MASALLQKILEVANAMGAQVREHTVPAGENKGKTLVDVVLPGCDLKASVWYKEDEHPQVIFRNDPIVRFGFDNKLIPPGQVVVERQLKFMELVTAAVLEDLKSGVTHEEPA